MTDPVPNGELAGVSLGLSNSINDIRRILSPNGDCANFLIAVADIRDLTRIRVWASMDRSMVYLARRNPPYACGIRSILRGRRKPGDVDSILKKTPV